MIIDIENDTDTITPEIEVINGQLKIVAFSDEFGDIELIFNKKETKRIHEEISDYNTSEDVI